MSSISIIPADRMSERAVLIACSAAYCIANLGWWVQPAIINEVMRRFRVGEADAGLVASVEMTSIALGSIIAATLLDRYSRRRIVSLALAVTLTGAAWATWISAYETLLVSRAVAGFGEGGALAVATAGLASFKDPDRAYGKINIAAILFGSMVLFSLRFTATMFGEYQNVFPSILVGVLALSPFLLSIPNRLDPGGHTRADPLIRYGGPAGRLVALCLASFGVGVTSGAMWSFYFVLGARAGLSETQINSIATTSALVSVLGAAAATAVSARFGRLRPVTLGITVLTVAIAGMSLNHDPLIFQIGACLNVAGMYFLVPYFLAYAAAQDKSGRHSAIVGGVFLLTGAVGPYLGGYIIENFDVGLMAPVTLSVNIVAWLLFLALERTQRTAS